MSSSKGKVTSRRGRTYFSDKDKNMFMRILREGEKGRFWKTIAQGSGSVTNQNRHDVWVAVAKHFSEAIGISTDSKQCKDLWSRIKEATKKRHDKQLSQFKSSCSCKKIGYQTTKIKQ